MIGTTGNTKVDTFLEEYKKLCEKHGFIISYDGGYIAYEVSKFLEICSKSLNLHNFETSFVEEKE